MLPLQHLYPDTPVILGHRGASDYAPENTLAAFRQAMRLGADGFELDVTLSADGVPIVLHDDTLDRTTDGHGPANRLALVQLKRLSAGYRQRFGRQFSGERIPTLEEVFEAFGPGPVINIELKHDRSQGRELAKRVVALIFAHGLQCKVLVSSFHLSNLRRVRRLEASLPLGILYLSSRHGLRLARWMATAFGPAAPPEAHHPVYTSLDAASMARYHAAGQRVNTWTANDPAAMKRLLAWGVDGLITDRPDAALVATGRRR